jgi:anti-anti-sigma regulatory factor
MQNISITFSPVSDSAVNLVITGELVIAESKELKQELLSLLHRYQSIRIELKEIERLDISALQLLVAAYNSAAVKQKVIDFQFEDSEYITNVLNLSGYQAFFKKHFSNRP